MTVSHEWPALTDLSGTPSHSATIRDVLLPSIKGRLEVQVYEATSSLPAAGDFSGQLAAVGSAAPYTYFSWTGSAWRVFGTPEFATTGARDALITSPQANDRCRVGSGSSWVEYVYIGTSWRRINATSVISLGSAGLSITTNAATQTLTPALTSTNELGATVSGNNVTNLPAGRYLMRILERVSLGGSTWVLSSLNLSGGSWLGDPGAEINAGAGYNALEICIPADVTSTSSTLNVTIVPNATITLRTPALMSITRLD